MTDTDLNDVLAGAAAGQPLSDADRAALHGASDLLSLGMAADAVRRHRHGSRMTFVRVAEVRLGVEAIDDAAWTGAGEVRITGRPADWPAAAAFVRRIAARLDGRVPLSGFSLADLADGASDDEVRARARLLRDAGLGLLAEAPLDRLQAPAASMAAAARGGLPVLRLTVDRAPADRRRALIDQAAVVARDQPALLAFAPLPRSLEGPAPTTGFEDVRLVALARLLVPIDHVQVDWPLYGPKLAQVGLTFGADDVDGVSPLEETGEGRRRAPLEEIRRNIRAASGEPHERDARFTVRG